MEFYRELELAAGETIIVQDRTLTLLDSEDGFGLFQLDADNAFSPVDSKEIWELLSVESGTPCSPR